MNELFNTLTDISQAISLLPLVVAIVCFKDLKNYLKPIFFLTLAGAVTELTIYLFVLTNQKILLISFTYTLVEFTLLSLFYFQFFREHFRAYVFLVNIPLFLLVCFIFSGNYGYQRANHYGTAVECFVFSCYCLYLFYFLVKNLLFDNLLKTPVFWINTAVLFYFTGNLIIFIFNAYIAGHLSERNVLLWNITHTFFNVSMNILFSVGFWKARVK